MKDVVEEKMESLKKYVPFIDFLLKIDRQKYIKFINIRKWILLRKKKYPLSDLNKIEQSIITQYKNLLVENNVQIPQNITDIFAPMKLKEFVNLCSDDEEDEVQNKVDYNDVNKKNKSKPLEEKSGLSNINRKHSKPNTVDDSDDDLEIVCVEYNAKTLSKNEKDASSKKNITPVKAKDEMDIDDISKDLLNKIDKLAADDVKMKGLVYEPNNYTYKENECINLVQGEEEFIYERRATSSDVLFKRRADFKDDDEVIVSSLDKKEAILYGKNPVEVISLDSCSDSEVCDDDERPSTSNAVEKEKIVNNKSSESDVASKKDEKVDYLCDSINSILPDMNELLNEEDEGVTGSTTTLPDKPKTAAESDKENSNKPINQNNNITSNTPTLSTQQISKLLEDISSRTELELETLYEALSYVKQINLSSPKHVPENSADIVTPPKTPPPAPPPINNSLLTPPVQTCYLPQQQNQMTSPLTPIYSQTLNFVPATGVAPPRRKININDPRIKKELQAIQNSPLFKYNVLNSDIEESIRRICQVQQLQTQQPTNLQTSSAYPNKQNMTPCSKTSNKFHKSSISYGEYKRRQLEKKLEMEKQREEERNAKAKTQGDQENPELSKTREECIRSKLLSTLKPCKEQLTTLWNQQKSLFSNTSSENNNYNSPVETATRNEPSIVEPINAEENRKNMPATKDSNQNQKKSADQKLNRIYNELKCTVKGFNQIQDYIPNVAEESLEKSIRNGLQSDANINQAPNMSSRPIGLRRRSSIHALSAISEQLDQQSDCSDSECGPNKNSKRRVTNSSHSSSTENIHPIAKRRKTVDEIIKPTKRTKVLRITDDDTTSTESATDDERRKATKETVITKEPIIKLRRLTKSFIKKHTQCHKKDTDAQNPLDGQSIKLKKTCEIVQKAKESTQKIPKLKKYNNDCQMTERSTAFCVLCRSKPSDLTNHYIGRHKTESYVSRLGWSELEDLAINTPFAKLQPQTKNTRFERYEVKCPFCNEQVVDLFINLYNHYSAHTGEYAFRCSHCQLAKPYRPDIQSHILHSKTCRNSSVQVMYRYPPNAQCIYLHYCTICNFVQLNEANVLKHLREHHQLSRANESKVQKCILTAMNDGPDINVTNKSPSPTTVVTTTPVASEIKFDDYGPNVNVTNKSPSPTTVITKTPLASEIKFTVDDDDIPVSNEPCVEDEYLEEEKYSLEEQLKQLHEGPSITTGTKTVPMTVIHSLGNNFKDSSGNSSKGPILGLTPPQRHLPMIIKTEKTNEEDKLKNTPAQVNQPVLESYTVYEKYRSFPPNVNYLGLFKCMIGDCYYSTDCSVELNNHLTEHSADESKPCELLQCPYCVIPIDMPITIAQLVDHIESQHGHLNYQCSICCYRSCDASNVQIHQQMHHSTALNTSQIYKCSVDVLSLNDKQKIYVNEQITKNVFNFSCKICYTDFFHTQLLINHLEKEHKIRDANDLKIYSCIYCPLTLGDKNEIRIHLATKHPQELPLIYDHNKQTNGACENFKTYSNVVDLSAPVASVDIKLNISDDIKENVPEDIKPDFKELLRINEETAKVRLRKLTAHTGVAPDSLYRCPELMCGGFFSSFELWIRHMRIRHHTLECQCPHCPSTMLLPLEQFALHFEQHRRHTFICFFCPTTNPTELLASQHAAQEHNDMGIMRIEKITFNFSYSYSVLIQRDLFIEREKFIAEFLAILDTRLKDFESNEIKSLKHQWPVQDNTPWLDEYLQTLSNRKVARRCLVKYCNFRTLREDNLYRHLNTSHIINGTQFNCSKCDYHVEKCSNFDEIFNHIKLHNEFTFICEACSKIASSRSKISSHIEEQHSARDVPVIHLFRTNQQMYIKMFIVFANNHLTFSTMKNCFCCSEQNMSGDVFSLHLKRYHKLSLNYYCEKCTNFSFKTLTEVQPHFQQFHSLETFKIRCELAAHNDLSLTSMNDFQIRILTPDTVSQQTSSLVRIKDEPLDVSENDVFLLEEDDIAIQNSLREEKRKPAQSLPKLKCASLSKLMEQPVNTLMPPSLTRISTAHQQYLPSVNADFYQFTPISSLPVVSTIAQTSYRDYNLGPLITNTNMSMNTSCSLNSALTNNTPVTHNNTVLSSALSKNENIIQIGSNPLQYEHNRNDIYTRHVQNSLYTHNTSQTFPVQIPVLNDISTGRSFIENTKL